MKIVSKTRESLWVNGGRGRMSANDVLHTC